MAAAIAKDFAREYRRPIPVELAARLLPAVASDRAAYDRWSVRWFSRWLDEAPTPTIEIAAEVAGCLADLPAEPQALNVILGMIR
jgi:hypothetical protein